MHNLHYLHRVIMYRRALVAAAAQVKQCKGHLECGWVVVVGEYRRCLIGWSF